MDDPALVGVVDRVADGRKQPQPQLELGVVHGGGPAAQPVIERPTRRQLHGEVVVAVVGVAGGVDCGDVGVLQAGQGLGLAEEHPRVKLVDEVIAAHDLERHPAPRPLLLGLPDHPHAALAEQPDDRVAGNVHGLRRCARQSAALQLSR